LHYDKVVAGRGCTGEFPPRRKKKLLFVPRMQKISGERGSLFFRRRQNRTPLPLPKFYSTPSTQKSTPVATISRYSIASLTELATQWHGGITCACHCVAKIANSQLPAEKNHPRRHNQLASTMGFLLTSEKYPLAQQVSRLPAHPTTHPSLPTLPTRCLLDTSQRGRALTPKICRTGRT
jgi:hypothetical protein